MVNFCLVGWSDQDLSWIKFTLKELAYRMGIEFYFSYSKNKISNNEFTVLYSIDQCQANLDFGVVLPVVTHASKYDCLHIKNQKIWALISEKKFDIIKGSYYLISLEAEKKINQSNFDSFGRIPPQKHPMQAFFLEPLLDNNAKYLQSLILSNGYKGKLHRFHEQYDLTLLLTHDVDGPSLHSMFSMFRSAYLGFIKNNKKEKESFYFGLFSKIYKDKDPYWNFQEWVELSQLLGAKSTFFFYPRSSSLPTHIKDPKYRLSDKLKNEMKQIEHANMEIGLHSGIDIASTEHYITSKKQIEANIKSPVIGHRAHYWAIDWKNPYNTWDSLSKAGFIYDMSLSPMTLGYRNHTMFPIDVFQADQNKHFFVLSTPIMDWYCLDTQDSKEKIKKIISDVISQHGILVLDWHVRSLFNGGAYAKYLDAFFFILHEIKKYRICFCTGQEVVEQWSRYIKKLYKGEK